MKKIIIAILLILLILTISFCKKLGFFDDKDACLDSGVCKAGLTIKIDGQEIIINKQSCIEHNGQWREKYNDCVFSY